MEGKRGEERWKMKTFTFTSLHALDSTPGHHSLY